MKTETGPDEVLGTPIQILVEEHGGQARVCREAEIPPSTLWRATTGQHSPTYATRQKLARAFGCGVHEIAYPADTKLS